VPLMPAIRAPRAYLREFLENHLHTIESQGATAPRWLHEAIFGLNALQYGETHSIFGVEKTDDWGIAPCQAKIAKMIAVGILDLLDLKGFKAGMARAKVGNAFGKDVETIKTWQFSFAPHVKDTWLLKFRQDIAKSEHWDEKEINATLGKAAKMYKNAIQNKNKKNKYPLPIILKSGL
jgi:hypothetical protein